MEEDLMAVSSYRRSLPDIEIVHQEAVVPKENLHSLNCRRDRRFGYRLSRDIYFKFLSTFPLWAVAFGPWVPIEKNESPSHPNGFVF